MNELLKERLFSLLIDPSQITNEEMQNAYGEFIKQIEVVSSGNNYSTIYRTLTATRIELASIEILYLYEQEKKCA